MNSKCKLAVALAPFMLVACNDDKLDQPGNEGVATSGDDVVFSVANRNTSRTMYQDEWDETAPQEIYWGNYIDGKNEEINIYCPTSDRGFAKYKVNLQEAPNSVAESVVKADPAAVGVQWGNSAEAHTFYAFYPADKASQTLENGNTVTATVDPDQSPLVYKYKENTADISTLSVISNFKTYNESQFVNNAVTGNPKTIYGMPDMSAAVMVARTEMPVEKFGQDVPLQFNVLADVLDITLNGPITPNTLNGNGAPSADFIQIQSVTIEVVKLEENKEVEEYEADTDIAISGTFKLNMSVDPNAQNAQMVTEVNGNPTVQLRTMTDEGYPTLYVRGTVDEPVTDLTKLDHMRLRAFLIPGQITGENLNKIRVHLVTNCGDFYQMLNNDGSFASGMLYPVKFGYFKARGADFDPANWIGQLDPNIYISELSIPGAWHAANSVYQGSVTLQQMYNAGVRAFEVHTKNGTRLMKYGDFGTDFDLSSANENFEEPFVHTTNSYEVTSYNNRQEGTGEYGSWDINGTTYYWRRSITVTNADVKWDLTRNEYTVPKFWLRLFRTQDTSESEPLSTAIINLAQIMNKDGLMFLEIGMDSQSGIDGVPYKSSHTIVTTRTVSGASVDGYQYGSDYDSWLDVYTWNGDKIDFANATETTSTSDGSAGTFNLSGEEAWSIAVRSCLERLSTETNNKTGKNILFSGNLTANTTIRDAQGQVIAKINTNNSANEASYLWGTQCPALFSRWISGSAETPLTINLQWKSPVAPYDGGNSGEPNTSLRWCFSELDNIGSSTTTRQNALVKMNEIAATNYAGGLHRTFYESAIGGYVNGSATEANCLTVAQELNTYALSRITNPTRQAVPLGLVFMNYVIAPNGQESTCNSQALIRAIINNNKAFLLNRAGGSEPSVQSKVNSHFTNNSKNPLK